MGVWSRLARTFRRGRHDADIEEELRFHLDMDVADGHSPRDARLRLGSATRIHEETRAAGILEWFDSTLRDVRIGWRQLRRAPGLTAAVVLSLTIGIGANAAIFSLVDAALLRPLPVSDPDSLRLVGWTSVGFPPGADNVNGEFKTIGVRMALGAATSNVIRMVLRDSMSMVITGILLGLPCAYVIGRSLRATLFRLEPLDPLTASLLLATLLTVALAAAWVPARRAARINPITAIREE